MDKNVELSLSLWQSRARERIFVAKDCSRPKGSLILLLSLPTYR